MRFCAGLALHEIQVERAALHKTLCSFATAEADDSFEEAMQECKKVPCTTIRRYHPFLHRVIGVLPRYDVLTRCSSASRAKQSSTVHNRCTASLCLRFTARMGSSHDMQRPCRPCTAVLHPSSGHMQALVKNEEAEEREIKAFRYSFRFTFAGPLLNARRAASAAAGSFAVDFLALADVIAAHVAARPENFPTASDVYDAPVRALSLQLSCSCVPIHTSSCSSHPLAPRPSASIMRQCPLLR